MLDHEKLAGRWVDPGGVARTQEDGRILFGVYLVDYWCLGVKDAYTRVDYSTARFQRDLPRMCANAPIPCSLELAHELIYGALEYAKQLGFEPHPDFYRQKADQILDPAYARRGEFPLFGRFRGHARRKHVSARR
jgi:hypothetical protein